MDGQGAAVETTVSAEPEAGDPNKVSALEIIKAKTSSLRKRIDVRSLTLMAAGFILLLAVGRSVAPLVKVRAPCPASLVLGQPQEQGPERDDWGLPSLEHFEQTLPPKLREGKEALAAWASEFFSGGDRSLQAAAHQRAVAHALSKGSKDSIVGLKFVVKNARPLNWSMADTPLPLKLRITKVLDYYRWNLMVIAENVVTKQEYSVNIPVIDTRDCDGYDVNAFQRLVRQTAQEEEHSMLQACGDTPANLAASKKGIAVTVYTGEISGLDQIHFVGDSIIYGRVALMEKVLGDLAYLRYKGKEVEQKARNYIASRLLQIVLKVELLGVGHLQLDWSSLFLREDGSFLLGNFGSGAPFGEELSPLRGILSLESDPYVMSRLSRSGLVMSECKTNMWSLGVLLFQLYTGEDHPYGKVEGPDWAEQAESLSQQLLRDGTRSDVLIPKLDAAEVPERWAELILRLLEPQRAHRIGAFQVIKEFPDLIKNTAAE